MTLIAIRNPSIVFNGLLLQILNCQVILRETLVKSTISTTREETEKIAPVKNKMHSEIEALLCDIFSCWLSCRYSLALTSQMESQSGCHFIVLLSKNLIKALGLEPLISRFIALSIIICSIRTTDHCHRKMHL